MSERTLELDSAFPQLFDSEGNPAAPPPSYQLTWQNGHLHYGYPPTTSMLLVPMVWLWNHVGGVSARSEDGSPDQDGETRIQRDLAALLSAFFVLLVYLFAARSLPLHLAAVAALVVAFGTMVFSTTSRALWGDTTGIVFLMGALLFVTSERIPKRPTLHGILVGSLLALAVLVRPINLTGVIAVVGWQAIYRRNLLLATVIAGLCWAAGFAFIHHALTGSSLPYYFHQGSGLTLKSIPQALPGVLFSPSRGLLVTAPIFLWVFAIGLAYRKSFLDHIAILGLAGFGLHLALLSCWPVWWGGHCYGARLMTGALPFLTICLVRSMDVASRRDSNKWLVWGSFAILSTLSMLINGRGAFDEETARWNRIHRLEASTAELWNWGRMQALWGLHMPAPPLRIPELPETGHIGAADDFQLFFDWGWSGPEGDFRWSEEKIARVVWKDDRPGPKLISIGGFTYSPNVESHRFLMIVEWNGEEISRIEQPDFADQVETFHVPGPDKEGRCLLVLRFPDAQSPSALGLGDDDRLLGIGLRDIGIQPDR
ncbi:hypothetical protein KQI84_15615 [bacterium]|nr:hypothetical protein [bacterium]